MINRLFEFWGLREKRFHLISIALIVILTAIVYANTLDNEFTNWDDDKLILNKTEIRSLEFDNLKKIFSLKAGGTYQPMRVFSYAIDYSIGKLDPLIYHLHNITLHILASILLYMVLVIALPRIERGRSEKSVSFMPLPELVKILSLFTALLFALHPVNVEAVTWLSSRKYVLLSLFSFASFLFYLQRPLNKKKHFLFYMLSFIFWVFAVMSSPFGVVLPALFVLFEYCCHPDINPLQCVKDNRLRFLPYILMGMAVLAYLLIKLGAGARMDSASYGIFKTMMQVFFDYMRNFISPFWLNARYVDYSYPTIFAYYKVGAGFGLLSCAVIASVYSLVKKKDKLWFFALFWFVISWLPASNIVPISTRMADRYIYVASVGFFVFFSWSICYFFDFLASAVRAVRNRERMLLFGFISMIVVFFSCLSVIRNDVWQNSGTLWENSMSRDVGNTIAHNNYGMWLYRQGKLEKAKKHFLLASLFKPGDNLPLKNLGRLYIEQKEYGMAEKTYKKILGNDSKDVLAHRALWEILNLLGRSEEAEKHLDFVLSAEPSNVLVLNQKGLVYYKSKQYKKALDFFNKAIEIYSDNPDLYFNLGMTLKEMGSNDSALQKYRKAVKLKPDYAVAYSRIGQTLFCKKDYKNAIIEYQKALAINAGIAEIYSDFGNVYFELKQYIQAKKYYSKALELNANLFEADFNLCVIIEKTGKINEAIDSYEKGIKKFQNKPQFANNTGSLLMKLKNYEKAEEYFLKAIEIESSFVDAHYNLAKLYQILRKNQKAIEHYKIIIKNKPEDIESHHEMCALFGDLNRLAEAEQCYNTIISSNPESALDHFQLGVILLKKGKKAEAILHFKKAFEIDPENSYFRQFISTSRVE
jgi:protein O-mannosyl-transferase